MEKELIKRIVNSPNDKDITDFIVQYVKEEKNIEVTPVQLQNIVILLQFGAFNLTEAIKRACIRESLTFLSLFDKEGKFLKNYVYE